MIKKIGIVSRRIAGKNIFSNDWALKAGKKVLKYIAPSKVDYIIFCTNTPEYSLPTSACLLQDRLGLSQDIGAFDVILACSGYVYSLSIAKSLIVSNQAKNIILITSDTYSKFIKKTNASTRILFGDGSSASLISSTKNKNSLNIKNFIYNSNKFNPHIMFVAKPKIIELWFRDLFKWLDDCEKVFGFEKLKGYETKRLYAYLAERYLSYWFKKYSNCLEWPYVFIDTEKNI